MKKKLFVDKLIQNQRGYMMHEKEPSSLFFCRDCSFFIRAAQNPDILLPRYRPDQLTVKRHFTR